MKTKLILAALCAGIALNVNAQTQFFVRPLVSVVKPTAEGYTSAGAIGGCAGLYIGAKQEHEISIETDYAIWNIDATYYGVRVTGEERYQPVYVNYRYHFTLPSNEHINFYFGPSLGYVVSTVEVSAKGYGSATATETSASWGFSVGTMFKLTNHLDIDIGYRYLYFQGTSLRSASYTYTTEDTAANALYAGLGIRFLV